MLVNDNLLNETNITLRLENIVNYIYSDKLNLNETKKSIIFVA